MATDFSTSAKQQVIISLLESLDIDTTSAVNLLTDIDASLDELTLAFGADSTQTIINQFASNATVPKSSETNVLSYTVPTGKTFRITGWDGWGDNDGEWFVRVDGTQVHGGRTSIAEPMSQNAFFLDYIEVQSDEVVTISVEFFRGSATQPFKAQLRGVLND